MNFRFQFFTAVGLLIISLISCSQPKTPNNIWTIIYIGNDEAYFYKGELENKSQVKKINIRDSLQIEQLASKNKTRDSIILAIKITEESNEDGLIDQMQYSQQIAERIGLKDRFGFVTLTEKEKKWFGLHDVDFTPPEPVAVQTPASVTAQELPSDNAFLIEIRKDNSVWYQILSPTNKVSPQKINGPITKNLKNIIANYEKSSPDQPKTYLLKGDGKSTYTSFEKVINALKENNIYKYNLVTAIN